MDVINDCLQIGRNDIKQNKASTISTDRSQLDIEQNIANRLNRMAEDDAPSFKDLTLQVETYFHKLKTHEMLDLSLSKSCTNRSVLDFGLFASKTHFLLIGYYLNILPYLWAKKIVNKKVKLIEFSASVLFTFMSSHIWNSIWHNTYYKYPFFLVAWGSPFVYCT